MPFKLFDFPIFNYFRPRSYSNGLPIFGTMDSLETSNPIDVDKSHNKTEDPKPFCETGPRDLMLKVPEGSDRNSPSEWSQHPFIRPNFSATTKTYKGPLGEWTVETRVGTYSGTSDQFNSEFFSSNFFGPDSGENFFESDTEHNFFGPNSGPTPNIFGFHFFGSGFGQNFFGSNSDSTNDNFSSNSEVFPFTNIGPGAMFDQLFGMLSQFQHFADSLDPYKPMGPPRI